MLEFYTFFLILKVNCHKREIKLAWDKSMCKNGWNKFRFSKEGTRCLQLVVQNLLQTIWRLMCYAMEERKWKRSFKNCQMKTCTKNLDDLEVSSLPRTFHSYREKDLKVEIDKQILGFQCSWARYWWDSVRKTLQHGAVALGRNKK